MIEEFKQQLGIGSGTAKEVVESACISLGVSPHGLTIAQQAQQCWQVLHGGAAGAQHAPAAGAATVPTGLPVSVDYAREEEELSTAMALSASMMGSAGAAPPASCGCASTSAASPPAIVRPGSFGTSSAVEARELLECPVCFEELCAQPCAYFIKAGKRVCAHAFHQCCALELTSKQCPLCRGARPHQATHHHRRAPSARPPTIAAATTRAARCAAAFDEARVLPSLAEQPEAWFRACDVAGDGFLTREQVRRCSLAPRVSGLASHPLCVGVWSR